MRSLIINRTVRDLLRHGGIIFVSTLVLNVASLIFHIACSRILGVHGYGAVYSMINVAGFVVVVAGIVTVIVTKLVADIVASGKEAVSGIARASILWSALAGLAFAVLTCALAPRLAGFLRIDIIGVVILALLVALQLALAGARGVLQGTQMFESLGLSFIIEGLFRAAVGISLLRLFSGVDVAMAAYAAGSMFSLIYALALVSKKYGFAGPAPNYDYERIFLMSSGIAISSVAIAVLSSADVVLVRHYLSNEESGVYGAIALVGKTLFFAVSFLPLILLPKAGQAASKGTSRQLLLTAGLMIGCLTGMALAVFYGAPNMILSLIAGGGYSAAAAQIFPYGIAMAALGTANGFAAYRMGLNDFSYIWYAVMLVGCEVGGIALAHRSIAQIVDIVLVVSIAFLVVIVAGLGKAAKRTIPDARDVILLREELEVR